MFIELLVQEDWEMLRVGLFNLDYDQDSRNKILVLAGSAKLWGRERK